MKKRIIAALVGICTVAVMTSCGNKGISNDKITIKQYKGLEVEKVDPVKVTDTDVEDSINSTLQTKSTQNDITDRPAQKGDVVTIDYEGKKDGVAFDGGTAQDQQLELGSGSFIDGFEDGIIGHNIGETFDLNLTFPETYDNNPDLVGQAVVFTVTLDKISEVIVPELTDELVAELSESAKTIEDYKKEVKEDLETSNKQAAESEQQQNVWDALMEQCTVEKYPKDKKQETIDNITTQYGSIASMYGMDDVDTFLEHAFGVTSEVMAENIIKQEYAVDLIAEKENLKVSDEDYKKGLEEYATQYGYTDSAELEEAVGKKEVKRALLQDKVTDWLVDNCKLVEKDSKDS